jgi:uncharacterized protein DUF6174
MRATLRFAATLLAVLPLAAHTEAALESARAKWRAAKLVSYEYGYHKFCECHRDSPPETVVTVRDGNVVNVRHRPAGSSTEVPAAEKNFEYYWTIDGLFDLIAAVQARRGEVRAEFDPTLGYPTRVYIDYDKSMIGDELDMRLTGVAPLAR